MTTQDTEGQLRDVRAQESTEQQEKSPRSFEELRNEMGEIAVERRDLRLLVTQQEREREAQTSNELKLMSQDIERLIQKMKLNKGKLDHDDMEALASAFSGSARMIHGSRLAGLFELHQLADFDDQLTAQYDQLNLFVSEEIGGSAEKHIGDFKELMSKEMLLRELEKLFNETVQQVRALYDAVCTIKPEQVTGAADGLCKCADSLFDFEVGGVLRVDEFVSYVDVMRENHAALLKLSLAKGIEMPQEFNELMDKIKEMLDRHESNLDDVKRLLAGQDNIMSFERYNELAIDLAANYKMYTEWQKKKILSEHQKAVDEAAPGSEPEQSIAALASSGEMSYRELAALTTGEKSEDDKDKPPMPIWHNLSNTRGGRRMQMGFKQKRGCEYGRCANCCLYYESGDASITPQNIMEQFENGMKKYGLNAVEQADGSFVWDDPDKADVKRMDFEMTGSFTNDNEIPPEAQLEVFEKVAKMPFKTIAIDSRLEYLTLEKVRALKAKLRPDQKLEISVGLESANNLIRELAVAKGYSLKQFEDAAKLLAQEGVDMLIHSLVKPALISEKEAFEDTMNTGRYISDLTDRIAVETGNKDFRITMKLEQAFIQPGGYLDYLHYQSLEGDEEGKKRYETPWTFTVAKVIQDLHDEGLADKLNLQIGKSDDWPPPSDVTRNRDVQAELDANGGVSSTDAIYEAMQQYAMDHDMEVFTAVVEQTAKKYPQTYERWKQTLEK
ncbi:MAG: hypothetical protein ABIH21_04180 [Patescibacteria group bacterium]